MRTKLLPFLLFLTFSLFSGARAFATSFYWVGSGNPNWSLAANWAATPSGQGGFGVPATNDSVYFLTGNASCSLNAAVNVIVFQIGAGYSGIITQGNVPFTVTDFTMTGGTFVGSAFNTRNITVRGNFAQTAGSFTASKGQLIFSGNNATHTFSPAFFHNSNLLTEFRGNATINGTPSFTSLQLTAATGKRTFEFANNITVENELILSGAGTLFMNGGTINLPNSANVSCVNTGVAGGGDALLMFSGAGNQSIYGASNAGESRLPRVLIDKTSGLVTLYNVVNLSNEFTNTSNSLDATSNFSKVIFTNGTTGVAGSTSISNYTITGNSTFYDLEFAPTANSVFDIPFGTTLTVQRNLTYAGANRANFMNGIIDVKGNMYVTNTSASGTSSTGVFKFTSPGNQNIYGSTTDGIGQLPKIEIIKPSGTLFFNDYINLKSGLVVNGASQLNDANAIMVVNGSMTIESTSNQLTLNNLLIPGNAGTSLTSNVDNSLQVNNLEVRGSANVVFNTSLIGSQNLFIKIAGNLTNTNSSVTNGGGNATLLFNGSGTQNFTGGTTIGGGKLPSIVIDKPAGDLILKETISLANGADWTLSNGNLQAGNSTLAFANSGSVISGTQTLHNLVFAPTALSNNYSIGSSDLITLTGNLTFDGPAGSSATLTSGTIELKKDLIINNVNLSTGSSTLISLTGTANQNIINNVPTAIANLTITKPAASVLTVSNDLNVRSTLKMDGGDINMNGSTFSLGSGATLATRGTLDYTSGKIYNGTFSRWYSVNSAVPAGSNTALFPVGTEQNYRRMFISTTSAPAAGQGGTIAVQHNPNVAAGSTDMSDNGNVILSYLPSAWNIASTVTGGTYDLNISTDGLSPVQNINDIRVVKDGNIVGTHGTANGATTNAILTRTGITAANLAGTFRIGSKDAINPLPVELLSFKAEKAHHAVNLKWETASEKNNDFFAVERSSDGRNFEMIGQVKGAGNSNTSNVYAFTDKNPVNGLAYYRLKQTDFDGKFEYSKIINLTFEGNITATTITAYPNPVTSLLHVKTNGLNGKATLEITDVTGRTLKQVNINATGAVSLDVAALPKGLYQLRVTSENGTTVSKFLKQ